jgi:Tfp pilus assembly pilus retraction ATPase PilT
LRLGGPGGVTPLSDNVTTDLVIASGRIAVREVCVHAPNLKAVIQRGNDPEFNNYMLAGRESGMIDFPTALKSVQSIVDPADYQLFAK